MSKCDREDVKKDIFQVTLLLVVSVSCQQISQKAAVSRLTQRPATAENGSFRREKAESILGQRYSKRTVQNLTFVSLNSDFNVWHDGSACICAHEKQSEQIILLHAKPTAPRQPWLIPARPMNFHPKQMCLCLLLSSSSFFSKLHNTSNPTLAFLLGGRFQPHSDREVNSTLRAPSKPLIFNCSLKESM